MLFNIHKMKIDIWSDIRCPFCYVGKKNLETALAGFPHRDKLDITWHSFLLDPDLETQPEKNALEHFSESKGIPVSQAKEMFDRVLQIGKEAGIEFNFDDQKVASSYRAHLLLQLAASKGIADKAEDELFKAQLCDGKNIDDYATLVEIGRSLSIDEEQVKNALDSDELKMEVSRDLMQARQLGISGVPFFIFNDKYAVSGAQPASVFSEVLEKSWSEFTTGDQGLQIISNGESCDTDGNCD